jgi:hypothetical protein
MSDLKQLSALTALNEMMAKGYFDICTIDSVADLLGLRVKDTEPYRILRPLHCVNWQKMPAELREAIPGLIQECLGVQPAFQFKTLQQPVIELRTVDEEPKRGGFLRLLGGR